MAYPESFLQELAEKNDIVDVVSDYVKLSKRSGQSLFGLCPFHSEKTPSFSVSPGKQIYHCFGCGKGGSVINFIMEIENLSFPEAVEFLAKRCGMKMPEQDRDPGRPRREKLFALNRDAAMFFHEQFFSSRKEDGADLCGGARDRAEGGQELRPRLRAGFLGRACPRNEGQGLFRKGAH